MTQIVQLIGEREAGALFETIEDALRFAFESAERGAGQGTLARLQKPRGGPSRFDDKAERVGTRGPSGAMIGHAWLSKGGEVYDGVLDLTMPKGDYLRLYAAVARQTYTAHEAASLALERGHWGPWP